MATKRKIEVFSAGCAVCHEAVSLVRSIACPSCEIVVADMSQPEIVQRAKSLGVHRIPSLSVDGKLAACCNNGKFHTQGLLEAGLGQPVG